MAIGILPISLEYLQGLVSFTGQGFMVTKAPKDMRVLAAHVKPELNQVWLTVESPDIEAVEQGKPLPLVDVTIATLRPEAKPTEAPAEETEVVK